MLNQKQPWPPPPEIFRGSDDEASGTAHQFGWSKGRGKAGTVPFHGASLWSSAFRGGGKDIMPCAEAEASSATAVHTRIICRQQRQRW